MAKRVGFGRKGKKRVRPSRPDSKRVAHKGKHARRRSRDETDKPARSRASSKSTRSPAGSGREAIVREVHSTGIEGQLFEVEERGGERWQIECLGEPVEVGARILFLPLDPESARRGEMLRIAESQRTEWVCTLRRSASGLRLTPFGALDQAALRLTEKSSKQAEDGTRVVVVADPSASKSGRKSRDRSTDDSASGENPSRRRSPGISVRVVEVLGKPLEPDSDHRALVWKHRLARQFSRRARLEVEEIPGSLSAQDLAPRLDLRHLPFVTIDPVRARDHDDAVFAETRAEKPVALLDETGKRRPNHGSDSAASWTRRLWVAIADVSHYVREGGWIDAEARRRGNSFYFPDRALPMLPERLSSDLCSLRPDVDRLAMVVELRMTADGQVADALFHEAVIRSRAGLSYEAAAEWLAADAAGSSAEPNDWGDSLRCLNEIAGALSQARQSAGAIALELPEIEILLDDEGRAIDAQVRARNPAHLMIEEAMLAANRAVARALDLAERETIHRVHPPPSGQKLAALAALLAELAIEVKGELDQPGVLAKVLEEVKGTPSEERIHVAALRSLSQARYEAESSGHYALRFKHYLHFTSPIRRYADLDVHRTLKKFLRGESSRPSSGDKKPSDTARLAIWLSGRERVAVEVEREAEAMACCAIMRGREGERFKARVTGATEYGLFIRLDSPATSGLVPIRTLEGHWVHDPAHDVLIGERSGRRIGLGDRIVVRLLEVDAERGRLAFGLVTEPVKARRPVRID